MTESEHLKIHSSIKVVTLEKLVKTNFSRTLETNQSFQKSKENLFKKNGQISLATVNFVAFLFAFSHPPLRNATVVSKIGSLTSRVTTKTSDLAATRGGRVGVKLPKMLCYKRTVAA